MNFEERVDRDFTQARRRALLRRMKARVRKDLASNQLLSFDEIKGSLGAFNQAYLGMRIVPVIESIDPWRFGWTGEERWPAEEMRTRVREGPPK